MILWSLCLLSFLWGFRNLVSAGLPALPGTSLRKERAAVEGVVLLLREIEETLAAGLVPEASRWEALRLLQKPWGVLVHENIQELRRQGAALLPTLVRLREFASYHREVLTDAQARSAQAVVQALACAGLVPLFGMVLYLFLPGVDTAATVWILACLTAVILAGFGARWILAMAADARWAGLPPLHRPSLLAVQCAGERFVSLLRAGTPADIAWSRCCEWLSQNAPSLTTAWGHSLWASANAPSSCASNAALQPLVDMGESLRKSAQVSLLEGRPCLDRSEAALRAFRCEMKSRTDRELSLLSTRALKPLFICVAPAILGILGLALWLSFRDQMGGMDAL